MSNSNYKNYQAWRKRSKERLVQAFGGKCGICGYDRCSRNLAFHHLDPTQKDFIISRAVRFGWSGLIKEAKKCVLLCANCHGEVHEGIISVPETCPRFNEKFSFYENWMPNSNKKKEPTACLVCGRINKKWNKKFCSPRCSGSYRTGKLRIPTISAKDISDLLDRHGNNWLAAGRELGISDNALRKRAKSRGLPTRGLRGSRDRN